MNDLNYEFQSAYRQNHSTETVLLHLVNYILIAMDIRRIKYMVMLDLSAAFDTLDHDRASQQHAGLEPSVTDRHNSYLRGQSVNVNEATSDHLDLPDGQRRANKKMDICKQKVY